MAILHTIFGRQGSEEKLIERLRAGDAAAAEQLYRQHARYLTAVCSRYLANDEDVKDVLQEAFLKVFSTIGRFRYQGEGSLRAWMTRITINESIDYLKAKQRMPLDDLSDSLLGMPDEPPPTEQVPAEVLHRLVRELPEGYRLVFNLYVMEGKSHREIASMLGIKEGTSASQLYKAKATLATKINQYIREKHE